MSASASGRFHRTPAIHPVRKILLPTNDLYLSLRYYLLSISYGSWRQVKTRSRVSPATTLPIGALSDVPALLAELQQDPWSLLMRHGLDESGFADSRSQIPAALHGRILDAAARASGCAHFGLLLGQKAALDNVGELRFLLLNATTIGQALDHLVRFSRLSHRAIRSRVTRDHGYTNIAIDLADRMPGADQLLTAYTAAIVKVLRAVIGQAWSPSVVRLALRRPADREPYRRFFRSPVEFDEPEYAVVLPDSILESRRSDGDPRLAEYVFERMCELEAQAPDDIVGRVRHAIEGQLLRGECSVQQVARMFAMHRKTLHARLRDAGTSFRELRDECRRVLADRMLQGTDLPIAEIATALCYRDQASLTRAFHRWHGQSPRAWRAAVAPGQTELRPDS